MVCATPADGVLGMVPVQEERAFAAAGDTYPHARLRRCPPPPTDEYIVVRNKSGKGGEGLLEAASSHKVPSWTSKAVLKLSGAKGPDVYFQNVCSDASHSSRLQLFLCVLFQLTFSLVVCGAWFGTTGIFDDVKNALGARDQGVAAPPPPLGWLASGVCANTCQPNGVCEDGAAGSREHLCPYGHDCHDCGWRPDPWVRSPAPPPTPLVQLALPGAPPEPSGPPSPELPDPGLTPLPPPTAWPPPPPLPRVESDGARIRELRLTGDGDASTEGRLEVRLANSSEWKGVCADVWGVADAATVCLQLGFVVERRHVRTWGMEECGARSEADRTATGAISLVAGKAHTCALLDTGDVKCWGWGKYGRLGYDGRDTKGDAPGEMASLGVVYLGKGRTAIALAAGEAHTCALLETGNIKCWGYGQNGRLGYDSMDTKGDAPGEMAALGTVYLDEGRTAIALAAGSSHTCALLDTGNIKCWGLGGDGQLGYDSVDTKGHAPGEMAALGTVYLGEGRTATALAAGYYHTCALLDTGDAKCWGAGGYGRLGYNSGDRKGHETGEMAALGTVFQLPLSCTHLEAWCALPQSEGLQCPSDSARPAGCWAGCLRRTGVACHPSASAIHVSCRAAPPPPPSPPSPPAPPTQATSPAMPPAPLVGSGPVATWMLPAALLLCTHLQLAFSLCTSSLGREIGLWISLTLLLVMPLIPIFLFADLRVGPCQLSAWPLPLGCLGRALHPLAFSTC